MSSVYSNQLHKYQYSPQSGILASLTRLGFGVVGYSLWGGGVLLVLSYMGMLRTRDPTIFRDKKSLTKRKIKTFHRALILFRTNIHKRYANGIISSARWIYLSTSHVIQVEYFMTGMRDSHSTDPRC